MDKFAKSANKAAKELSTTTTKYTDASLIFFQQGLTDAEVEERTRATIKLANVTGESVESISNQLTAVWNNFDDGTKSLEYYADVITALGAATASSSSEITDGLEKFAAIAETVGLSYEYATSALATVTATTRQSADVVGTAFKTLFARIQDLELGNTLDDGTTLG
jgi:TP901 family phage tail tape measure protein